MIGFLDGEVIKVNADNLLLKVGGVGYRIYVNNTVRSTATVGNPLSLYIHTHVEEKAIMLFGFSDYATYEVFLLLTSVSGIGSKTANNILETMDAKTIITAIALKDSQTLTKLPGIGKKSAERMILELADKVKANIDVGSDYLGKTADIAGTDELTAALVGLGYTGGEIQKLQGQIDTTKPVEQQIKAALKLLSRQ